MYSQFAHAGEGHTKEQLRSTEHTEVARDSSVYPFIFLGVLSMMVIAISVVIIRQKFTK